MPDLLEDLIAFVYATDSEGENICPVCGSELEENEEGEFQCPKCFG